MIDLEAYPEILNVKLGDAFLSAVRVLLARAERFFSWEKFGRLPCTHSAGGRLRYWLDLYHSRVCKRYCYLYSSPAHEFLLRRFRSRATREQAALFDLFCLNAPVEAGRLEGILSCEDIDLFLRAGLFIARGDAVRLAVTLVPYDKGYYLAEARHLIAHRGLYGIEPAHISEQTHQFVVHARRLFRGARVG